MNTDYSKCTTSWLKSKILIEGVRNKMIRSSKMPYGWSINPKKYKNEDVMNVALYLRNHCARNRCKECEFYNKDNTCMFDNRMKFKIVKEVI